MKHFIGIWERGRAWGRGLTTIFCAVIVVGSKKAVAVGLPLYWKPDIVASPHVIWLLEIVTVRFHPPTLFFVLLLSNTNHGKSSWLVGWSIDSVINSTSEKGANIPLNFAIYSWYTPREKSGVPRHLMNKTYLFFSLTSSLVFNPSRPNSDSTQLKKWGVIF